MPKSKTMRTRKLRRKAAAIIKHGRSAAPVHKRIGGRTGHSMRKDGKAVNRRGKE